MPHTPAAYSEFYHHHERRGPLCWLIKWYKHVAMQPDAVLSDAV